jgi:ADP-ribose pyrophosphatase YjhB (NUDIX family)
MKPSFSTMNSNEDKWDSDIVLVVAVVVPRNRERGERKILLIREGDDPYHNQWVLPQGQPKPNETLLQTAVRECLEEVGLNVRVTSLLGVYDDFSSETKDRSNRHIVIVSYDAEVVHEGDVRSSTEAKDHVWVQPSHPPRDCPRVVRQILSDYNKRQSRRFHFW